MNAPARSFAPTARGERLSELARRVRDSLDADGRVGDPDAADDLVREAEGLMKRWAKPRWRRLGARSREDLDDLLQCLRSETVACVAGYNGVHKFSTYLAGGSSGGGRWTAAANAWRSSRPIVRVPYYLYLPADPAGRRVDPARRAAAARALVSPESLDLARLSSDVEWPDPAPPPDAAVAAAEHADAVRAAVAALLARLDARSAEVVRLRFFADPPLRLREVGAALGVGHEWARRIEHVALRRLAAIVADDPGRYALLDPGPARAPRPRPRAPAPASIPRLGASGPVGRPDAGLRARLRLRGWLSPADASRLCGAARGAAVRWADAGLIPARVAPGGKFRRIDPADLAAFADRHGSPAQAAAIRAALGLGNGDGAKRRDAS
jgi:DNA-directed RNA polymerase specialized sigma24 family protein